MAKNTNTQRSVATFSQVKIGGLFINGVPQKNPSNPCWDGDIPHFDGKSTIAIQDLPSDKSEALIVWNVVPDMKQWTQNGGDTLLIADRVLLTNVSWEDLAEAGFVDGMEVVLGGKRYRLSLLSVGNWSNSRNAWNHALRTTTKKDDLWHWKGVGFWGENEVKGLSRHAIRGSSSSCAWSDGESTKRSVHIGFRPVLEPLDKAVPTSKKAGAKRKKGSKTTEAIPATPALSDPPVPASEDDSASTKRTPSCDFLCDALGVEPKTIFEYGGVCYKVTMGGMLYFLSPKNKWELVRKMSVLADLVNNAKEITSFSLTKEEKKSLKELACLFGENWTLGKTISRDKDGKLTISDDSQNFKMELSSFLFPSIKAGMVIPLNSKVA